MEIIKEIFGEGKDLDALQMASRTLVVFIITILFIRLSGRRSFGKKSSFDNTIAIMLGAVLSRAITGASAFWPTVVAALVLVLLHRLVAWLVITNKSFGEIVKGHKLSLYKEGNFNRDNMKESLMSEEDLMEAARTQLHENNLAMVKEIYMETSGELTVVKNETKANIKN